MIRSSITTTIHICSPLKRARPLCTACGDVAIRAGTTPASERGECSCPPTAQRRRDSEHALVASMASSLTSAIWVDVQIDSEIVEHKRIRKEVYERGQCLKMLELQAQWHGYSSILPEIHIQRARSRLYIQPGSGHH
jgi:hypothetical protein